MENTQNKVNIKSYQGHGGHHDLAAGVGSMRMHQEACKATQPQGGSAWHGESAECTVTWWMGLVGRRLGCRLGLRIAARS